MDGFIEHSVAHTLEVVDEESTTFRTAHVFEISAVAPSRFFKRQFFWTGSGSVEEPLPELVTQIDKWGIPKHKIHGPLIHENISRIFLVDLGRTLSIGERDTVHFLHQLKDLNGTFEGHLGTSPKNEKSKIERLSLCVILPEALAKNAVYEVYSGDTKKVTDSEKLVPASNQNGRITFKKVIDNPIVDNTGHRIRW